jgi:hypothetical protein
VSFDQLMAHAEAIKAKAVQVANDSGETTTQLLETGGTGESSVVPMAPYGPGGAEAYYADVPDLFRPFSQMPDPKAYQPMIDQLHTAMANLCTSAKTTTPLDPNETYGVNIEMAKMNDAASIMSHWSGVASVNFKENFLSPFDGYAQNQFTLVAALKGALEAQQSLWSKARDDIDNAAHLAMDALDHAGGCDPTTLTIALTVVGAFVPVFGVFEAVADVTALAFSVELVAAVASTGAGLTQYYPYTGHKAYQVIDALKDVMKKIDDAVDKGTQSVDDGMTKLHQKLVSGYDACFVAPRPDLTTRSGDDLDGDNGVGRPH